MRPVENTVLALIDANPGLTARQLARALAETPPSIAAWVERLQARGLIERRRSVRDGRVQRLLQAERVVLAGLSGAERSGAGDADRTAAQGCAAARTADNTLMQR
jgi:DNA-binding transcriptional ArsR family regulator